MRLLSLFLFLIFPFFMSACGYHSVYGTHVNKKGEKAEDLLASIYIETIPDRSGQILRNELLDLLYPKGRKTPALYRLKVSLSEAEKDLGIKKDQTSSRILYRMTANVKLYSIESGKLVKSFSEKSEAKVNLIKEQFSVLIAADTGKRRALKQLAEKITNRLRLFVVRDEVTSL